MYIYISSGGQLHMRLSSSLLAPYLHCTFIPLVYANKVVIKLTVSCRKMRKFPCINKKLGRLQTKVAGNWATYCSFKKSLYFSLVNRKDKMYTEENVAKTKALETAPIHEMKF